MGDKSTIEWTDATWNPVRGCSIVSKGCTNCYAMKMAHRSSGAGGAYEGLTKMSKGGPVWTGDVRLVPELLEAPLHWRRPRRVFVNSMSDLFHEDVPEEFIDKVFAVMRRARDHTYQILTKRGERMRDYMTSPDRPTLVFLAGHQVPLCACDSPPQWPLPNVWLGVSVEDQAAADARIPLLLQTPAAVRWISAEPLLGPVRVDDLADGAGGVLKPLCGLHWEPCVDRDGKRGLTVKKPKGAHIAWVVAGGESGPGARPMHPDWARSLRDQCAAAGVPFFFKQWGAHKIGEYDRTKDVSIRWQDGATEWFGDHADIKYSESWLDDRVIAWPASKKSTGRQLDGRTHDEYPA